MIKGIVSRSATDATKIPLGLSTRYFIRYLSNKVNLG
jgi:hypothetical protein